MAGKAVSVEGRREGGRRSLLRESKDRAVYGLAKEEGECWHGSEDRNMAGAFKECGFLRERDGESHAGSVLTHERVGLELARP